MNRHSLIAIFAASAMLIATLPVMMNGVDAEDQDWADPLEVDGLMYDESKRYVTKQMDVTGMFIDGTTFDNILLTIITDADKIQPEAGVLKVTARLGTQVVFEDSTEIILEDDGSLYILEESGLMKLEPNVVQPLFLPALAAGIVAILSAFLTTETVVALAAILGAALVTITLQDLRESVSDAVREQFPNENPESITSEYKLPGDITIIAIDEVPTMMHYGETNQAANLQAFETATMSQLDSESYYLVCKIDDAMTISPVPFDRNVAEDIIDEDSPLYHVWTLSAYAAMDIVDTAECHMFPFEITSCNVHYGHWHDYDYELGVYYYSNSMAFFGLYYNAQDDDTYLDEDDL